MKRTHGASGGGTETTSFALSPPVHVLDDGPIRKRRRRTMMENQPHLSLSISGMNHQAQSRQKQETNVKNIPLCSTPGHEVQHNLPKQEMKLDTGPCFSHDESDSILDEIDDTDNDDELLSEQEKATHAIMVQLATGIRKDRKQDLVDARLEQLIRKSRFQAMHPATKSTSGSQLYSRTYSDMSMDDEDSHLGNSPSKSPQQVECGGSSMPDNTMDVEIITDN